ncbi:hypothetical protein F0562_000765 [Nyssa sinensis]|uniref:Uncharacterized protein n=1 Tax=Nyssa sinensis TaxID=561372 RepID=A0A5J5C647_9ASTE|nr:hypothetical protein F0562_000765 [Nyssa sinensis]
MAIKGFYLPKDEHPPSRRHQQEPTLDYCMLGSFQFNTVSSSDQLIQETAKLESIQTGISLAAETKKEQSLASLELINNYANGYKKLKAEKLSNLDHHEMIRMGHERKLSTEEIMRLAGERYIQFCTQRVDDVYMLMHPFGSALSGLSLEETQDVELVHLLLAAAEMVSNQQFERANRLLTRCDWSGVHWTVLMQALADQHAFPIEHLKITAVGTTGREKIEETGKRLASFSESLNLPFSFNVVFLSEMKDVKEELFDIESDEAVAIYAYNYTKINDLDA